jgi:carbamoyl-phosphate synthase large subunit
MVMITVNDHDKPKAVELAQRFHDMGFGLVATTGTAKYLRDRGVPCDAVKKVSEGHLNGIDLLLNGDVHLLINTPLGKRSQKDDYSLRQVAISQRVPYTTTLSAASAASDAIQSLRTRPKSVRSVQEWLADIA